jgi:DNA repair photolyase
MTFYEVHAKSLINRVAAGSQVPFHWTLNPYRGCGHACVYCLSGDTEILMADGRTKPLADVRAGDKIYGTEVRGAYRRYVKTEVLAHWSTEKSAYRVTLDDATTLVASGEHRFLTDRGWKHVTGATSGAGRRPFLTRGVKLMGVGDLGAAPKETDAYRRGYLCGMIRGDGSLGTYEYPYGVVHRFKLALTDQEALDRSRHYLAAFGVYAHEFEFQPATDNSREVRAIRTSRGADVEAIRRIISWPEPASEQWECGFLAGIYDAEGGYRRGMLRIANADPEIIERVANALSRKGFTIAIETLEEGGLTCVRIVGGLREQMRFFQQVDPAITRKRAIEGKAIKSAAKLGVAAVEELGITMPMFDITTGTGDFIANGVVSHNCFARKTHEYLDLDSGHDFDTQVVVKINAPEVLRRELAAPRWRGGHVAIGANVDCYQRAEGRYRLMRGILAAFRDFANPFSILTKGTLITRDIDLLTQAAAVTTVGLAMSIGFVDETLWRLAEPGTPSPRRRLDAVRQLTDAGLPVGVLMAPILPGLTDTEESIEATVAAIEAAGATSVVPLPLHLRPGAKEWYLAWLARHYPQLAERYAGLYRSGGYLADVVQREITARVRVAARRHGLEIGGGRAPAPAPAPVDRSEQLTLL